MSRPKRPKGIRKPSPPPPKHELRIYDLRPVRVACRCRKWQIEETRLENETREATALRVRAAWRAHVIEANTEETFDHEPTRKAGQDENRAGVTGDAGGQRIMASGVAGLSDSESRPAA